MARTAITLSEVPYQGIVACTKVGADASNEMYFLNDGLVIIGCNNVTAGGDVTLAFVSKPCSHGRSDSTLSAYAVSDGDFSLFGPFDPAIWNQAGNIVHIDVSGTTTNCNMIAMHYVPRR